MGPRRYRRGCLQRGGGGGIPRTRFGWGRDVTVADVELAAACGMAHKCFNGAATLPSRMLVNDPSETTFKHPSSTGRYVTVADVCTTVSPRSTITGFNGAATLPSRMSGCWVPGVRPHGCFNGAATLPSRMFGLERLEPRTVVVLQWGRDVTVADVMRPSIGGISSLRWLQWGRDVTVADVSPDPHRPGADSRLQWGRDVTVADV